MKRNLIYLPFLIILFILGFFVYLMFVPFKEPTINPYPIPILNTNKIVHYGEPIQTKLTSCTYQAVPTTVSVRYQNSEGRIYYFASHDGVGKVGCHTSQQNRDPIPSSLNPGKYVIYITAVFHVTSLKDVTKVYQTEGFVLMASPSAGIK